MMQLLKLQYEKMFKCAVYILLQAISHFCHIILITVTITKVKYCITIKIE